MFGLLYCKSSQKGEEEKDREEGKRKGWRSSITACATSLQVADLVDDPNTVVRLVVSGAGVKDEGRDIVDIALDEVDDIADCDCATSGDFTFKMNDQNCVKQKR